jgi:hypothetical protein
MSQCVPGVVCNQQHSTCTNLPIYTGERQLGDLSRLVNRLDSLSSCYTGNTNSNVFGNQVTIPGRDAARTFWPVNDYVNGALGPSNYSISFGNNYGSLVPNSMQGLNTLTSLSSQPTGLISQTPYNTGLTSNLLSSQTTGLIGQNPYTTGNYNFGGLQDTTIPNKMFDINKLAGTRNIIDKAQELKSELTTGWTITRSGNIENILKDLSAEETAAVELVYDGLNGDISKMNTAGLALSGNQTYFMNNNIMFPVKNAGSLRNDIRNNTYSPLRGEIFDLLNRGADVDPRVAAIACNDEMKNDFWSSIPFYTKVIDKASNKSTDFKNIMEGYYSGIYGGSRMQDDVRKSYDWTTGKDSIVKKLNNN